MNDIVNMILELSHIKRYFAQKHDMKDDHVSHIELLNLVMDVAL